MAINVKFDLSNNPEPPTIILGNRNGRRLGRLDAKEIEINDKFNEASEITFTLYKYIDNKLTNLWDKVVDFKLIYCKEWDLWFEIRVELDEATETIKTVFGTQLGQAELSQLMLYNIEINTEEDIARDDYKKTILYNSEDAEASLLNRLLKDKAPHYSIAHVDSTIANIQRMFSFDKTSIHDAFQEIAEEIGCLFVFNSGSDKNGKIQRTISVYDLQQNCNDCGYRGEFIDECPKCSSKNIQYGYGKDTTIFVTADELADDNIQLTTDTDAVKNCFRLEAGDDLMTSTIRNCNPNGTNYIWYFSDDMKAEMSDELVTKIERYNKLYKKYYSDYKINLQQNITLSENISKKFIIGEDIQVGDTVVFKCLTTDKDKASVKYSTVDGFGIIEFDYVTSDYTSITFEVEENVVDITVNEYVSVYLKDDDMLLSYNTLVEKYREYYNTNSECLNCGHTDVFDGNCPNCNSSNILVGDRLQSLPASIIGYSALMNAYYNTIDLALFLESGLMPTVEMSDTSAEEQSRLLTTSSLSPVAVANIDALSQATADNSVLAMAKVIIRSTYKVEIKNSSLSEDRRTWEGNFTITNYSDEKDTYTTTESISVEINGDNESFIKQKIEKALNKEDTDDLSISSLFKIESLDEFKNELKKYALNPLKTFHDACQACIDILVEQGIGDSNTWANTEDVNLYDSLYIPYNDKLLAIEAEIKIREDEINLIKGTYDLNDVLIKKGVQTYIIDKRNQIQDELNFEKYLGDELWLEFCTYRREDEYSNDNYISDGLNNAELFKRAMEFIDVANNEIFKSAELQHSISTDLKNLLAIPKFKPLVKYFELGNWIRILINEKIYKLRLLEYGIDFSDFSKISVDFSDVTKIKNGITDVESILSKASSMATSYSSVKRQASQGEKSNTVLNDWFTNGLDTTNSKIIGGADNQNQVWDKNGILCREYDPITESYSDTQLKIINSTIAITDDNWKTTKTAIGNYYYTDPSTGELNSTYGVNGETIVGKLFLGSNLKLYNEYGNLTFDKDGLSVVSDKNSVNIGNPNSDSIFEIKKGEDSIFAIDNETGQLTIVGNIEATDRGTIACWTISSDAIYKDSATFGDSNGMYFGSSGLSLGNNFTVTSNGQMTVNNAKVRNKLNINYDEYNNLDVSIYEEGIRVKTYNNYSDANIQTNPIYPSFCIENYYENISYPEELRVFSNGIYWLSSTDLPPMGGYTDLRQKYGSCIDFSSGDIKIKGNNIRLCSSSDGGVYLGDSGSVAVTSDENLKYITDIDERYENFFMKLKPVLYRYKNNGHRQHIGFGARQVEQALYDSDITLEEFAGVLIDKDVTLNINNEDKYYDKLYSLRYEEFVGLYALMLQKAIKRIDLLENEIKILNNERK